eukprot:3404789-Prymnesium_polylepis.1
MCPVEAHRELASRTCLAAGDSRHERLVEPEDDVVVFDGVWTRMPGGISATLNHESSIAWTTGRGQPGSATASGRGPTSIE